MLAFRNLNVLTRQVGEMLVEGMGSPGRCPYNSLHFHDITLPCVRNDSRILCGMHEGFCIDEPAVKVAREAIRNPELAASGPPEKLQVQ